MKDVSVRRVRSKGSETNVDGIGRFVGLVVCPSRAARRWRLTRNGLGGLGKVQAHGLRDGRLGRKCGDGHARACRGRRGGRLRLDLVGEGRAGVRRGRRRRSSGRRGRRRSGRDEAVRLGRRDWRSPARIDRVRARRPAHRHLLVNVLEHTPRVELELGLVRPVNGVVRDDDFGRVMGRLRRREHAASPASPNRGLVRVSAACTRFCCGERTRRTRVSSRRQRPRTDSGRGQLDSLNEARPPAFLNTAASERFDLVGAGEDHWDAISRCRTPLRAREACECACEQCV